MEHIVQLFYMLDTPKSTFIFFYATFDKYYVTIASVRWNRTEIFFAVFQMQDVSILTKNRK